MSFSKPKAKIALAFELRIQNKEPSPVLKADEKYKGKTVQFTAKVTYVSDEYAVVEPSNADVWDWDCDVQICFEDMDDLKKVTKGKTVTIVGECYGQADMYTAKICRAIVKK